jgi:hypothetical protein
MRNARVLHAFIPLRSTVGFELWVGNRAGATGFLDESRFPWFRQKWDSCLRRTGLLHGIRRQPNGSCSPIRSRKELVVT